MSYCGAQLFEAIGLDTGVVTKYFRGTASQVGGMGVFEIAEEALRMHRAAYGDDPVLAEMLDAGGEGLLLLNERHPPRTSGNSTTIRDRRMGYPPRNGNNGRA